VSITPKNWKSFQHYKDRSPAWIKLHKGLMTDFEFNRLPLASRALAPMLWLLASEYEEGEITASRDEIAFRLHVSTADLNDALNPLIDSGFFIASEPLADCKQDAIPEKRRDREDREETEKNGDADARPDPSIPEREYFMRGREVLGKGAGGLIGKLLKAKGGNVALARAALETASTKEKPSEYVAACCRDGPVAKPLTEFQRKQQETNDVRAELRNFGKGSASGGALDRLLPDDHGQRSEGLRGGLGPTVLAIPGASGGRGH
jgi:hypothetical protein